jgi:hypothetical protein
VEIHQRRVSRIPVRTRACVQSGTLGPSFIVQDTRRVVRQHSWGFMMVIPLHRGSRVTAKAEKDEAKGGTARADGGEKQMLLGDEQTRPRLPRPYSICVVCRRVQSRRGSIHRKTA